MKLKTVMVVLSLSTAAFAQDASEGADAPVADTTETPSQMRVRWGVNGVIGYFPTASAVDFGASARVGVQLSDLFGLYADFGYVAGVGFGGSVSGTGGSLSVSGVGFWHVAPMAEATFGSFFVAGGPMLAGGGWGGVTQGADTSGNVTQLVYAAGGTMPGLDLRTGFTFGGKKPDGRRGGFTIGVDLKLLNAAVTSVSNSAGGGGASTNIAVGSRVWGIAPMLMLGYDAK